MNLRTNLFSILLDSCHRHYSMNIVHDIFYSRKKMFSSFILNLEEDLEVNNSNLDCMYKSDIYIYNILLKCLVKQIYRTILFLFYIFTNT